MNICRNYRNSTDRVPTPFLYTDGELPIPAVLVVDLEKKEAYITLSPGHLEPPEGVKAFPWEPRLTIRGIDQALAYPGIEEALEGVLEGRKDSEDFLWEVLGAPGFFNAFESFRVMDPRDYFEEHPLRRIEGESPEDATKRVLEEAIENNVLLDPLITEMEVEEALWT
jgi:hypothetical protein